MSPICDIKKFRHDAASHGAPPLPWIEVVYVEGKRGLRER
jgi:hypothetical protein